MRHRPTPQHKQQKLTKPYTAWYFLKSCICNNFEIMSYTGKHARQLENFITGIYTEDSKEFVGGQRIN